MCQTVKANVERVGSVLKLGVVVGVTPALHSRGAAVASQTFRDPASQGFPDIVRTTLHGEHTITHTHKDETYSHRSSSVSVSRP